MTAVQNIDRQTVRWKALLGENGAVAAAIVAAGIVGALVALVVSFAQDARYVASTSVSFRPRVADIDAAEAADRIGANFAVWIESEAYAARLTVDESGGLAPLQISANTEARAVPKEMRVLLDYEDSQPGRAASVANGLARVLVQAANKALRDAPHELALDIEPMDPARIPDGPAWPRAEIAAAIGAVLGLALSAIVAATLGWLREPYTHGPTVLKTDAAEPN